ncbi:MAG: orotate phosphoribosyltransferase [Acidobacteria bacterium]|nr:orotate phosphoribosyltransferase [Acidobacteriota bacterium]
MRLDQKIGELISILLWEHRAIQVSSTEPFQLSSGNFTPLYINCRLLISYPGTRSVIVSFAQRLYHERQIAADCIAGGETAGIPFGAWLAERLDKPFVYVRKKKKEHGTGSRLEGVPKGEVLLFEDLITDGGSKLSFIEAIREAGCMISRCLVLVDREQGGEASLARVGVKLHSLVGISRCLETGRALSLLSSEALAQVKEYLADPSDWHRRRGLDFIEIAE